MDGRATMLDLIGPNDLFTRLSITCILSNGWVKALYLFF